MHKLLNAILVVLILLLTFAMTWWFDGNRTIAAGETTAVVQIQQEIYETLPENLILKDRQGKEIALSAFKGKVILLNFWATWCIPCIAEFDQFINLAQALPDDLVILAVSIDDKSAVIEPFLQRHVKQYSQTDNLYILWDEDKSVSQEMFQTIRVPETLIITPEMKIARKIAGLSLTWDSEETIRYLSGIKSD